MKKKPLINPDNDISETPVKALAAAVVIDAAKRAKDGDQDARAWLLSDGILWCEGIGYDIHPDRIARWVRRPRITKRLPSRPRKRENFKTYESVR